MNLEEVINRRAAIENRLFLIASGKAPLLTQEDCRVMALKLGTPREQWGKYLTAYKWGDG